MAICTRLIDTDAGTVSSAGELFRFHHMPMHEMLGGDIWCRGDSMDLLSDHWGELEELLVLLNERFDSPITPAVINSLGNHAVGG